MLSEHKLVHQNTVYLLESRGSTAKYTVECEWEICLSWELAAKLSTDRSMAFLSVPSIQAAQSKEYLEAPWLIEVSEHLLVMQKTACLSELKVEIAMESLAAADLWWEPVPGLSAAPLTEDCEAKLTAQKANG
jgi:hypothetical protein